MNSCKDPLVVVPCSGIGKPFGTVSREAAYDLCDELRPGNTRLVALTRLVLDVFRRHKDLKPEGIAVLNEPGRKLARVLAEEIAESLDSSNPSLKGASDV